MNTPKESHEAGNFQAPQSPESQHDAKYDNDTPDNWLRGNKATDKPDFDKGNAWRKGRGL